MSKGGRSARSWWCFCIFSDVAGLIFGREKKGGGKNKSDLKNCNASWSLCRPWVSERLKFGDRMD